MTDLMFMSNFHLSFEQVSIEKVKLFKDSSYQGVHKGEERCFSYSSAFRHQDVSLFHLWRAVIWLHEPQMS